MDVVASSMEIVGDVLQRVTGRRVIVQETTNGYDDFSQQYLPGDRTVILSDGSSEMFFAVNEDSGTVYIPEAYDDANFPIGPTDSTGLISILARRTDYDVDFKRVFER